MTTTEQCERHHWLVVGTTGDEKKLTVECDVCGTKGRVDDPIGHQFEVACAAPIRSFLWEEHDQVAVACETSGRFLASPIQMKRNGYAVHSAIQSILNGLGNIANVLPLLRRIKKEDMWREYIATGETLRFEKFEDFVRAPLPYGLGSDMETIDLLCRMDATDGDSTVRLRDHNELDE